MQLKTILNRVQKFKSFVYGNIVWLDSDQNLALLVEVLARANSKAICSGCGRPGPSYDTLEPRMFEFVPFWNIAVFFVYALRRVNCKRCGVKVETVPWAEGKHTLTKTYMHFLATWAKRLSWKDTAAAFRTTWEKVFNSVEWAVQWGSGAPGSVERAIHRGRRGSLAKRSQIPDGRLPDRQRMQAAVVGGEGPNH